ncbi:ATPase family protein associated with various cellular activities (AAA) [Chitinophaga skermanii]|uniref:ATPase family protein associated with various cellular activities (AAA) n=1 Tax=Chitinophaga skermanii TaxID=331697 RepID=A0A327QWY2_9BACT|nr:ATP-binding protein [Chitinophaga skermanii]RAJ08224.1 ATPase family protein associated with various cellular activities (AAA) [Chitinophaga skermanii]
MHVLDVIINEKEKVNWSDISLDPANKQVLDQLMKEFRYIDELKKYNLPVDNKIMLHGSSGCGKTTTAKAIASTLDKNLYILNLSTIVSSKIGETANNLKMVFDKVARDHAVLFLDEFDHIGKTRGEDDRDVGEMRRLVNTLIQLIDYFPPKALLVAATNHLEMIDHALVRRFQLRLQYNLPSVHELNAYYDKLLTAFPPHLQEVERLYGISYAEAKDHLYTSIKSILINDLESKAVIANV